MEIKVAVLVGSLRQASLNLKMARALIPLAPAPLSLEIINIGSLPLYNQDLETDAPPEAWTAFRTAMQQQQAVLFVTPEYNRSVPGALKNAIDVGSRPMGKSIWSGKPTAIVSLSPGATGGFGANHHLRQCLVFLNMPAMQQPEAYIGGGDKLFDDSGQISNQSTHKYLQGFMDSFHKWIKANLPET